MMYSLQSSSSKTATQNESNNCIFNFQNVPPDFPIPLLLPFGCNDVAYLVAFILPDAATH
jgi:hypothetical protein